MKKNMRIIIDIILFIMFILLMGYHITGNAIHEILGVITFILFIVHHIINLRWYKMIFKGKYNFYRIVQMIFNTLLFLAMIGIMISSVMISSNVFSFLNLDVSDDVFDRLKNKYNLEPSNYLVDLLYEALIKEL